MESAGPLLPPVDVLDFDVSNRDLRKLYHLVEAALAVGSKGVELDPAQLDEGQADDPE